MRADEQVTVSALCDVSPVIASGGGDAAISDLGLKEDAGVDIAVVDGALVETAIEPWTGPSLWIMGDSTVTDQPAQVPYAPGTTYAGWGQMLPMFLEEQYCVINHAHSGLSSETFRERRHAIIQMPGVNHQRHCQRLQRVKRSQQHIDGHELHGTGEDR